MHFPIVLVHLVSNSALRAAIGSNASLLVAEEPVFASSERFRFTVESASNRASLFKELQCIVDSDDIRCVIVISDGLTTSDIQTGLAPNDLTQAIRRRFLDTKHLCGLVALAPGATRRIQDIDCFVDTAGFDLKTLKMAITKTANGLRLKAPPGRQHVLAEDDAIKIQAIQSKQQLRECLKLRFQIYGLMGYLADKIASNPAELEMDSFDLNSVHFVAVDHRSRQVAGTARLVVPQVSHHENTLIGNPHKTLCRYRSWCNELAMTPGADVLRHKLAEPYFLPLPILQSSEFRDKWREMLDEATHGGEISRVVVSPRYRGLGVSALLIRAAIATAYSIAKRFVLLECIPVHAKMYAKYGFRPIEGHHNRVQELDQTAVGMQLQLDDQPGNRAVQTAKCDIRMIQAGKKDNLKLAGMKYLCLCRNKPCWSKGAYGFGRQISCPLRTEHTG